MEGWALCRRALPATPNRKSEHAQDHQNCDGPDHFGTADALYVGLCADISETKIISDFNGFWRRRRDYNPRFRTSLQLKGKLHLRTRNAPIVDCTQLILVEICTSVVRIATAERVRRFHIHAKTLYLKVVDALERAKGIEPSYAAWEAAVLPLNYARGLPRKIRHFSHLLGPIFRSVRAANCVAPFRPRGSHRYYTDLRAAI